MAVKIKVALEFKLSGTALEDAMAEYDELSVDVEVVFYLELDLTGRQGRRNTRDAALRQDQCQRLDRVGLMTVNKISEHGAATLRRSKLVFALNGRQ